MKLHELGAQRPTQQIARAIENQAGQRIDFDRLNERNARTMLARVQNMLREHRTSPSFHYSERNPDYMKLVMLEQALTHRLGEVDATAAVSDTVAKGMTPQQQSALQSTQMQQRKREIQDQIRAKQKEISDLQRQMNTPMMEQALDEKYMGFKKTVAAVKKGGSARDPEAVAAAIGRKKYGKEKFQKAAAAGKKLGESRLTEGEVQQAQVVMAAQDMVDQMQKVLEQVSAMQFKDLPALTDAIKNDIGVEQATQFQNDATAALTQLLTAVQTAKTQLETAQGVITGQAPVVPGQEPSQPDMEPSGEPGAEIDADLSLDANLPADDEEDEVSDVGLGRERR